MNISKLGFKGFTKVLINFYGIPYHSPIRIFVLALVAAVTSSVIPFYNHHALIDDYGLEYGNYGHPGFEYGTYGYPSVGHESYGYENLGYGIYGYPGLGYGTYF
ncbi:hypothetical protein TNIN_407971 [Trichonephila inaurata madagascariensis]|uniref:Uncharacterized protein n=1 Tax=Trichonephila inaurata madagascariensis TaxID=2747483 RepID=A0A8X6YID5_9ARAC|nr:hypothetical protein TNIN_407971 [Trichonephila inaurata madagascariensis]